MVSSKLPVGPRVTIDVPVELTEAVDRALREAGLETFPYIKRGNERRSVRYSDDHRCPGFVPSFLRYQPIQEQQ